MPEGKVPIDPFGWHDGPVMPASLPPPRLVDTPEGLRGLTEDLSKRREIGVDTEADSFFAYREKVCLIQISTEDDDWIVDPLAPLDLSVLGEIFAAREIRKVFHDAEYDVALLKRAGLREIGGIFDTRLGVALLGSKTPGLSNVLRERFGIELDKSMQRSDWRRRPLSEEQLEYARHDTRHLIRLAREVAAEIEARRLVEIFQFECARTEAVEQKERVFDPDDCVSIRGARELSPTQLSALRELAIERDRIARARDEAAFRVAGNDHLAILARMLPRSPGELHRIRALPGRTRTVFGEAALAALARARAKGPWTPPPREPAFSDEDLDLQDRLRRWRTRKSEEVGLDSSAVLNRHTLDAIVRQKPSSAEDLAAVPGIAPWQIERYGEELLAIVREALDDRPVDGNSRGGP